MPLNNDQRLALQANAARDRAEHLVTQLQEQFSQTQKEIDQGNRPDLTPEQIAQGEQAMRNAIAAAQRMVANLNSALEIAEAGFDDEAPEEPGFSDRA